MQLLHHWTTRGSLSHDPTSDDDRWIWSEGVVDLAFKHTFLLHGLLALSALHKTLVDSQGNRAGLLAQADVHMSAALSTYLRLLEESAPETVVPCFLMSSVCLAYNLATAQVEEPEDPLSAILHCFRLLRGVKVVIGRHWALLRQDDIIHKLLGPVLFLDEATLPEDTKCLPLLALKPLAEELDTPQKDVCLDAINDLHETFVKTTVCSSAKQEHGIIMTWPVVIKTEFLDICNAGNHVGALIIVYWAVLIARDEQAWWLKGWLSRLIRACEELFAGRPELREWLAWPIEIYNQCPEQPATLCSTVPSPMVLTPAKGSP
ncbi:hypothetical protein E8E13_008467 [Curvularia kusanoi]|uniref:Uncharacterized protein n=1 Tax=Curvularia kusanoi TaxID=90978 RepID=A0A9P4W7Z3_CURKU|nr:hypothetical protein E8E13_008467 [Curvularia kusanoi]